MLLDVTITALAPLAFPERKAGTQFRTSLPYVPGATLYGALGSLCYDPELFTHLRCHNAYPAFAEDSWVRPLPATAIQPKGDKNVMADALVERVCWEIQQPPALIYAPTDPAGRPWEAVGRTFYTLPAEQEPSNKADNKVPHRALRSIEKRTVQQRVLTRVAINRRRGTAQEGMLYSPLVLNEVTYNNESKQKQQTMFRGSIVIPEESAPLVEQHLADIDFLGGRQSSGLGHVALTASPIEAESPQAIQQRVERMTEHFAAQAELYEQLGGEQFKVGTIFTVNLLSDAILLEQGWLPTQELSAAMLKEATGIDATLLRSFTMTAVVGGWNVSWQRPKPSDIAVSMGSVYVFRTKNSPDYKQLARLQLDGIGERRAEGYGQVRICDEFHLDTRREL
jgi:CRISPR-associated protein Csx10